MNRNSKTTNLSELPLNLAIWKMAIPTIGAMLIESLYHLVDSFWIGKLGAVPLAAASATAFFIWMAFSFSDLGGVAANTLVSQAVGAGNTGKIQDYLRRCLVINFFLSLIIMMIYFPLRNMIFVWLGLEYEVITMASEYLTPWLIGLPVLFSVFPVIATFRGSGDARTPMIIMGLMVILNVFLDPLFIFGFGPIPPFGLKGAAWVTVICHFFGLTIGIVILKGRGLFPGFTGFRFFYVALKDLKRVFSIGMPMALNGALFSLTYIGLTWVISFFGTDAVASIGMGHRIESYPWFVSYGFSVAAAALVGQYVGANQPRKAEQAAWKACIFACLLLIPFAVLILFGAEPVIRFFIDDPAVILEASVYLRISAICWLIGVFEVVLQGAFSGSGRTLPPLVIGMPLTVLRIPVSYYFAVVLGFGIQAIWLTIGASTILKGLIMAYWFSRGGWKKGTVLN